MKYLFLIILLISGNALSQSYHYDSYKNRHKNTEFEHDMDRLNDQMDKMDAQRQAQQAAKEARQYREKIEYEQSVQRRKRLYGF